MPPFAKHLGIFNLPSKPLDGHYSLTTDGETGLGKLNDLLKASEFLNGGPFY